MFKTETWIKLLEASRMYITVGLRKENFDKTNKAQMMENKNDRFGTAPMQGWIPGSKIHVREKIMGFWSKILAIKAKYSLFC